MKKALKIIIPIGVVLIIAGLAIFYRLWNSVPDNAPSVIGNTAGNLNSKGLFCEYDGKIYFSNPYDHGYLYSMNPDCTNIKFITEDSASYINAAGKYLYYVKKNNEVTSESTVFRGQIYGVMRRRINGSSSSNLTSKYCNDLSLTGSTLIYNTVDNSDNVTCTIDIQGDKEVIIAREDFSNSCVADGNIYFSDNLSSNHGIYMLNTSTKASTMLLDENTYMANLVDGYLYYIDLDNDQSLNRINMSTYEKTVLTTDHCILYNVYNDVIFYQCENDTHALMKMNADGSNPVMVTTGDVSTINCTSEYTFFQFFNSDNLYRTPTNGAPAVESFLIAEE